MDRSRFQKHVPRAPGRPSISSSLLSLPASLKWIILASLLVDIAVASSPSSSLPIASAEDVSKLALRDLALRDASSTDSYGAFVERATQNALSAMPSTQNLYSSLHKRMIQIVALSTSTFTIAMVLITSWFFFRMQKRLRHKLVMLSISGCFSRGLWYFIFGIVVLGSGPIDSRTAFCQAAGFFIQLGNEMSDIATFFIALHGALQIFRPTISSIDVSDGLHEYRRQVYGIIIGVPILLASLPFVNSGPAYTAQGAFCALPTAPIWYRLALAWGPRYFISLSIIALSIAVYVHVELKFRSFSASQRKSRTSIAVPQGNVAPHHALPRASLPEPAFLPAMEEKSANRRGSLQPVLHMPNFSGMPAVIPEGPTEARADPIIGASIELPPPPTSSSSTPGRKVSIATSNTSHGSSTSKSRTSLPTISATLKRTGSAVSSLARKNSRKESAIMTPYQRQEAERRALRRQLRLIFVYPIVYVILWIPPAVLANMQYFPKYQGKLPPQLAIVSTLSLTLMGGIDCVVFLWREKPWRRRAGMRSTGGGASHSFNRTGSSSSPFVSVDRDVEKGDDNVGPTDQLPTSPAAEGGPLASALASATGPTSIAKDIAKRVSDSLSKSLPLVGNRASAGEEKQPKTKSGSSNVARERAYERLALEKQDRRDAALRSSIDGPDVIAPNAKLPPFAGGGSGGASAEGRSGSPAVSPGTETAKRKEWWDRTDSISTF